MTSGPDIGLPSKFNMSQLLPWSRENRTLVSSRCGAVVPSGKGNCPDLNVAVRYRYPVKGHAYTSGRSEPGAVHHPCRSQAQAAACCPFWFS